MSLLATPDPGVDLVETEDFDLGWVRVRPSVCRVEGTRSARLEPRVMKVLIVLARAEGRTVTRDQLIEACWEGHAVTDDAVARIIAKLRTVARGFDPPPWTLETLPKVGFRLVRHAPAIEVVPPRPPAPAGGEGDVSTLAVLPFTGGSRLARDRAVADALGADVIAGLSQAAFVRVLSGAVTSRLRGRDVDIISAARVLGVRYLMDGQVRRSDANMRVDVQMSDAANGSVLWLQRFERPFREWTRAQEPLALEIAGLVQDQVHQLEMKSLAKRAGEFTAWEAVIRSTAAYRDPNPMLGLFRAVEEARRAVALAPDYAPGCAQLAASSGILYFWTSPDDPEEVQRLRALAERALALDPDDTFVSMTAGGALTTIGLPNVAVHPLTRAVRKAPNLGQLHFSLGWTYCLLDRHEEALASLREAARLLPTAAMRPNIDQWVTNTLIRADRWPEVAVIVEEMLALRPDNEDARLKKALAARHAGRDEEARALVAALRDRGAVLEPFLTGYRRALAGNEGASHLLDEISALWRDLDPV